jgi:hypothetical protein
MANVQHLAEFPTESGISLRAGFGVQSFALRMAQKCRQQLERIGVQGAGYPDEFHDVQPPLAALVFGDKGLRFFQAAGESVLGQTGGLAGTNHQLAKRGLVGGMDGFADRTRG